MPPGRSLKDQSVKRSHPNKAVDVFATKLLEAGFHAINSCWLYVPSSGFLNAVAGNGSAWVACLLPLAGYAASAVGAPWRSGSYTSPLTHSRCNSTANFRATATAAVGFGTNPTYGPTSRLF